MKKSKKRAASAAKPKPAPQGGAAARPAKTDRRETLRLIRDWGAIALIVGLIGWWLVDDVRADIAEQDVTRIGDGTPSIVQIHDPQCGLCRSLQREVRSAMADFEDDELQYIVANIRTPAGRAVATEHAVEHVTLLFFDGAGERRRVLSGVRDADLLRAAFRRHVAESRAD